MARKTIIESILRKSSGCFLWVRLVLNELKGVHTIEEVREVLEDIPNRYRQTVFTYQDSMSTHKMREISY